MMFPFYLTFLLLFVSIACFEADVIWTNIHY